MNNIFKNISALQSNSNFIGGEKPSQFKVPKPQDMVLFRKTIETGNFEAVKKSVWDNPRYLVSSGDTPAILHVRFFLLFILSLPKLYTILLFMFKFRKDLDTTLYMSL